MKDDHEARRPQTSRGRRVATPLAPPTPPQPQPSAYCTERVLRWRLQECQRQLALTTEELRRTRCMLEHFQRHQDKRWQWEQEQVSEEVERKELMLEELKADMQKVAVLALTHREGEMRSLAEHMWPKWSLSGPIPRRPTKETTRTKDLTRLRARKRWQHVSRFVAYAFCKKRQQLVPIERFLAYRVKELCDLFQASFDERFGVYEALTSWVRHAEIEQSVREKLQRPKKAMMEKTTTFEALETQMISSYTEAFEEAGGVHEVNAQLPEVAELLRGYRRGRIHQDLGNEILGLKHLYEVNQRWLPKFEEEVNRLALATRATPLLAPLKSYERARAKVLTRYGSDASCLTDVMRASLVYATIAEVYSALLFILKEDQQQRPDFKVMEVNDRFQFCHDGYRDITLLFEMSGVICEVQMQVKGIQDVKKSGGHKAYRVQREVNELIFEAAVQNSQEDLGELVRTYNFTGQGTRDKNGRSALHYTCQHGALKATRVLLAAGSHPWQEDDQGVLPFELALKQKCFDTLELTLSAMMHDGPSYRKCFHRIAEHILPWWCANVARLPVADDELLKWRRAGELLIDVMEHYQAMTLLEPLLMRTAQMGQLASTRALLTARADQELVAGGESLLDAALKRGQAAMVKMLVVLQRGDGTPRCAHCFKETVHGHLRLAAKLADSGYARAALLASADPRSQQAFGVGKRTPLMSFAASGDLELCEELVAARAEVQWIDGSCCSAVHYALSQKRQAVAEFLRAQRATTEVPLKHNSIQDIAQYLLKATQEGCCGAIHRGADSLRNLQFQKKQSEMIQYKEVLRECFGPSQWTLLHYAVKVLKSADPAGQVCRALLLAKADPRHADLDGETSLHWAAAQGLEAAYEALAQGAYRAEAEDQTLQSMGRGAEVEDLPEVEPLLAETRKCLKRQLLRMRAEVAQVQDEDTIYRLQAGFLAFRHSLLSKRLVLSEESVTGKRSLGSPKAKELKPQKSLKPSTPGSRRNSLVKDVSRRFSAVLDRKKTSPAPTRQRTSRMLTKGGTKNLDVPDRRGSSSNLSRPLSASSVGSQSSRRLGSAGSSRQNSISDAAGSGMARQISGGSASPLRGFPRQISASSEEEPRKRRATFADEVEQL